MLLGAGIRGNQSIGALNGSGQWRSNRSRERRAHSGGTIAAVQHFGATLLALGDVDPLPLTGTAPISAVLRSGQLNACASESPHSLDERARSIEPAPALLKQKTNGND